MKTCARCGNTMGWYVHSVEGKDLCEDCYNAWVRVIRDVFPKFLGEMIRTEREVYHEKII